MKKQKHPPLYSRVREILESARTSAARSVNTAQVVANWLIGREIVEEEQKGNRRAGYGQSLLRDLSVRLTRDFGTGWSVRQLEYVRSFYIDYKSLLGPPISNAPRSISGPAHNSNAVRSISVADIRHAPRGRSWQPGQLHSNLSWTHYRRLLRVEKPQARAFFEIEAANNSWSAREMERQIDSLLYERLALSKDKKGLVRLAKKGQEIQKPTDLFKDPIVIEFLGLPQSPKLVESDLEQALIDNLQNFMLELGKGFAFVSRQERITLDGDHFYIDLVFYHTILKCFVLLDLKVGKLTHQDLGQLQLYVNYYDQHRLSAGDNPTLGLILCTDMNDTAVKYTLGDQMRNKIFTSRYKLHVPSEAQLKVELRRELRKLQRQNNKG